MAVETLLDELLSIARGSIDANELASRFARLVVGHTDDREQLSAEVVHSVRLLRIKAKAMESQVALKSSQHELDRMNLTEWANETRQRALELRRDADELERVAVRSDVIDVPERTASLRGLWKGMNITEEDIEEAGRSLFKGANDESI